VIHITQVMIILKELYGMRIRRKRILIIPYQRKLIISISWHARWKIMFGVKPPETVGNRSRTAVGPLPDHIRPTILLLVKIRHPAGCIIFISRLPIPAQRGDMICSPNKLRSKYYRCGLRGAKPELRLKTGGVNINGAAFRSRRVTEP